MYAPSPNIPSPQVNLVVRSPLETRVDPAEQTVDLNRPAVFKCAVLGHPVKGIRWYKDGRQLHRGSRWVRPGNPNPSKPCSPFLR